jgi:peptide/nickel transport system ATP-binding protein
MTTTLLLRIVSLKTYFFTQQGVMRVLDGLNLEVSDRGILGLVGESGSGKSVTAYSILRLVKKPGRIVGGQILFEDIDLLSLKETEMQGVRGKKIAMIFQNPRSSLNPLVPVGRQLMNVLKVREGLDHNAAHSKAFELFRDVGLSDLDRLTSAYPHELSGGMCQRVMIALALGSSPRLLIADEPTTGLDVTIQQQMITLLKHLTEKRGMSQIVISHDLGLVAEICDTVAVMYAGHIVERAPILKIFDNPQHPYTIGLLACRPKIGLTGALRSIPGAIPSLMIRPSGCPFHPRCDRARDICRREPPPTDLVGEDHTVACYFPGADNA